MSSPITPIATVRPLVALSVSIALSVLALQNRIQAAAAPTRTDNRLLTRALQAQDAAAIAVCVNSLREKLGDAAGLPEVPDEFASVSRQAQLLQQDEVRASAQRFWTNLEQRRWWKTEADPARFPGPLREPASTLVGYLALARAGLADQEQALAQARAIAEFLLRAQTQAGTGGFPFPAVRGRQQAKSMQVAADFVARAERNGQLERVVRQGWIIDDLGDGGLQFDNAECGLALLELHRQTQDERYLASARQAADWAVAQSLCPNWNYNSFSVRLLARTFAATGNTNYLRQAVRKALLGVIPGQLRDGPRVGRWLDPHNARPSYHYIMLAALAELVSVLPSDHPERATLLHSLGLGLRARNPEFASRGIMNKDSALEALLVVKRHWSKDAVFLNETHSAEALDMLTRGLSEELRQGRRPLAPGPWGLLLEELGSAATSKPPLPARRP